METLIQYLADQHILKDLANKQKYHSNNLVGPAIEVEVPPVTGCLKDIFFLVLASLTINPINQPLITKRVDKEVRLKKGGLMRS